MKICLSILLSFFICHLSAQRPDSIRISYSAEATSLKDVFEELEQDYGIRFSYACSDWMNTSVNIDASNEPLEDLLSYLLEDKHIEYKVVANNVLLRKAKDYESPHAQSSSSTLHLRGRVVMRNNPAEELPYATIAVVDSPVGTYTDEHGNFDIEIPADYVGRELMVSYLGYEDYAYQLAETTESFLLIPLTEQPLDFDEIVIVNRHKPIKIRSHSSSVTLSNGQLDNSAAGVMGSDINRNIQLLPGITAHDDDSAEIKIRGSNSDETLLILDGMPIYNTDHYYGIFSGINASYIDSVNVYRNSYPVHYGGKTGGLVEFFSKNDAVDRMNGSIGVDLLTMQGQLAVPLSAQSSLHFTGRRTHHSIGNQQFNSSKKEKKNKTTDILDFSTMLDNNGSDPNFLFHDLNMSYMWRKSNESNLQISLYHSSDELENDYMIDLKDINRDEINLRVTEMKTWATIASSLVWNRSISDKWKMYSRAYLSHYANEEQDDIQLGRQLRREQNSNLPQIVDDVELGADQSNQLTDLGFNSDVRYEVGDGTIKVGIHGARQSVQYAFLENSKQNFTGDQVLNSLGSYTAFDHKWGSRMNLSMGLRSTYYDKLQQTYFSPRLFASYQLTDHITFKSSYAVYQQAVRQFYYEYRSEPMELWVSAGENDIPVLVSKNLMVGTTFKVGAMSLDIEAYQKNLSGTVEYAIVNPLKTANNPDVGEEYTLFVGDGHIRGIDVMASYGCKNYDSYISYTLSKNQERYNKILNNRFYSSENDRRHQFKWINRYGWSDWTFDLNGIYSSGRPYTDVENIGSNGDIRNVPADSRLRRLPAYARVDFAAGYNFRFARQKISLTLSVFNMLNTQNVRYIQSVVTQLGSNTGSSTAVIGNESNLLNRTVNVGVNWEF